ncbi:MAG: rane dipeptidase [Thermoleophilaceae bacterium]|nr:rane dipeptidase [Thermoleophilaceae bacterium]
MIADLHIHYPMHLISDPDVDLTLRRMARLRHRRRIREWGRAFLLKKASEVFNYPGHTKQHRVDSDRMRAAAVRLGFSVLYLPASEFRPGFTDPPSSSDVQELFDQLREVERVVELEPGLTFAHDREELDAGLADPDLTVLVHCVEGGFQLGATEDEICDTVKKLKEKGVVYVTLAHLFWRHIATNANAFPFLRDDQYHAVFHERDDGLSDLGKAAIRAMVENRMLIDVAHMDDAALGKTFDYLRKIEDTPTPVLATHVATRRGVNGLDYNITRKTAAEIARRGGVIGLIMGDHIVTDGLLPDAREFGGRRTRNFGDTFDCLRAHIDTLYEWCGNSYDHIGIGSDLDGFVKPTVAGIDFVDQMDDLESAISGHYSDPGIADKICSGNALQILRDYVWTEV